MPVMERSQEEPHFSEGEPDLEPPEELAVGELDEDTMLEEELDNEDILEEDVDEEILSATLEHLVHIGDPDGEEVDGRAGEPGRSEPETDALDAVLREELELLEVDELEDVEEGLDLVLAQRLAEPATSDSYADSDADDGAVRLSPILSWTLATAEQGMSPCHGEDEFLCGGCFLVRHRALLFDAEKLLCRDCAG